MPRYRVALQEAGLDAAEPIFATGPAVAAARYVEENNLRPGEYAVQEIPDPYRVHVTVTSKVEARLLNKGGKPAIVEEEAK